MPPSELSYEKGSFINNPSFSYSFTLSNYSLSAPSPDKSAPSECTCGIYTAVFYFRKLTIAFLPPPLLLFDLTGGFVDFIDPDRYWF